MTRTHGVLRLAVLLALLGGGRIARADGMGFVDKTSAAATGGEVGKAVPTNQRAALVRDGASWSLILEPKYVRPKAGAAWLVPFAHCPTVSAADPKVLAELGLVTAPLFLEVCVQTCRCDTSGSASCLPMLGGSTGGMDDSGSTSAATNGQKPLNVDVWQSGSIGTLDFVVISAADPTDIPRWLDQGGYDNPPELATFVTNHAGDYGCYFAAKLGAPASEQDVFPAVRFDLDSRDPPSYPLRLTKMGVAEGQTLGVTLYVVNPADRSDDGKTTHVVPDGFDAAVPTCTGKTAEAFQACVDQALAANPSALAVTYHDSLASRNAALLGRQICSFSESQDSFYDDHSWCVDTDDAFTGIPTAWTSEVEGWMATEARITRYEARLPPAAMDHDLVFKVGLGTDARPCTSGSECYSSTKWSWDGTTCMTSENGGTCALSCQYNSKCPQGWTCRTVTIDGHGYTSTAAGCTPPLAATAATGADVLDPLPPADGLYLTATSGCGRDCDEVCYGHVYSSVVKFGAPGTPRTPRTPIDTLPALALLFAAQLLLAAWLRRKGGRTCAS